MAPRSCWISSTRNRPATFDGAEQLAGCGGIALSVNPRLVRGLDYYSRTVFEWVTDALGAQGAVCSGGRYDGLVEKFGGQPTPAVGWAMGIERFVDLYLACGGTHRPGTGRIRRRRGRWLAGACVRGRRRTARRAAGPEGRTQSRRRQFQGATETGRQERCGLALVLGERSSPGAGWHKAASQDAPQSEVLRDDLVQRSRKNEGIRRKRRLKEGKIVDDFLSEKEQIEQLRTLVVR